LDRKEEEEEEEEEDNNAREDTDDVNDDDDRWWWWWFFGRRRRKEKVGNLLPETKTTQTLMMRFSKSIREERLLNGEVKFFAQFFFF